MKNDLISREALIEMLKEKLNRRYNAQFTAGDAIARVLHRVKKLPAVDAEPVRHGQWLQSVKSWAWPHDIVCSMCGAEYNFYQPPRYCPDCGAKMDGGQEDD